MVSLIGRLEEGGKNMKTLYLKVEICKALKDEREEINYYILSNESYGLSICRIKNDNNLKKDEINIEDAFKSEEDVKEVIDMIVNQGNDLSQIEYIVEDYKKNTSTNVIT